MQHGLRNAFDFAQRPSDELVIRMELECVPQVLDGLLEVPVGAEDFAERKVLAPGTPIGFLYLKGSKEKHIFVLCMSWMPQDNRKNT